MTNVCLPLLQASQSEGSPIVINISSSLGSMVESPRFTTTSYQCSKAAVNMLTKCQAAATPSVKFVAIHPGWVRIIRSIMKFLYSKTFFDTEDFFQKSNHLFYCKGTNGHGKCQKSIPTCDSSGVGEWHY